MIRPVVPVAALVAATAAAVLGAGACAEPPKVEEKGACVSTQRYFTDDVWNAFMANKCSSCHNAQGIAASTSFVLQSASQPGFLEYNLELVSTLARSEFDGKSILLRKPTRDGMTHDGGTVIEKDGPEYAALVELIRQVESPVVCEDTGGDDFRGVRLLDPPSTLRKATLVLAGRLPTADERAQVDGGDAADLDVALDNVLREEAFYRWLKETYNDIFLTDKYINGQRGTELLDSDLFPNAFWYRAQFPEERTEEQERERRRLEQGTNVGVAREALELVVHLARNDRPWTELVTADYLMVNPFSAKSYGVDGSVTFVDPNNPDEFQPATVAEYPHSGVLTSVMWLNRFPTTETNRNRHRARMVYRFFLATDILRIADRPVDAAAVAGFNPTLNDPSCTVCHANIDPVAGAFQNWTAAGAYAPPADGWFGDMFPPGYGESALPFDERFVATSWLGDRIAEDPLFALATVHTLFKGLTGREPVTAPTDNTAADFASRSAAFLTQDALFKEIAADFVASGFQIRTVVKALVLSPYFRARDIQSDARTSDRAALHASLGTGQFLTPEMLDRKIEAVLGYPWIRSDGRRFLLDVGEYQIYFGGIDSDSVTTRITAPNGLMSAVSSRMAFEMSCRVGARDFQLPAASRVLFPLVESTYEPEDENGFTIPEGKAAIQANIVHLYKHVLDETVNPEDEEAFAAYELWLQTWRNGKARVLAATEPVDLPGACRAENDYFTREALPEEQRLRRDPEYTIRAWNAVLAYLLSDARFLHH
jgi:hypothetical protein